MLIAYGEVMSLVQHWEQALALVWWRATRKNPDRATGDFGSQLSQKEIRRFVAAFLRMPAQAVRESVEPHLEPQTASDLRELMQQRNELAHRFLRDRVVDSGDFRAGSHDELLVLGERFSGSYSALAATVMELEPYNGPVFPHWPEIADRIVERVFRGQRIPRDPREQ